MKVSVFRIGACVCTFAVLAPLINAQPPEEISPVLLGELTLIEETGIEETTVEEVQSARTVPIAPKQQLHSFDLDAMPAQIAEMTVQKLFPGTVFSADSVSNTLYFRCDEATYKEIVSFIERADAKAYDQQMKKEVNFRQQMREQELRAKEQEALASQQMTERETLILRLKHIAPQSLQLVIRDLELDSKVNASVAGDALVLRASGADLRKVAMLAQDLDVPQKPVVTGVPLGMSSANPVVGFPIAATTIPGGVRKPVVEGHPIAATTVPGFLLNRNGSRKTVVRDPIAATSRPSKDATLAEQMQAFRARQDSLRKQIAFQRERLAMLEQRLEAREKQAEVYFNSLKLEDPETAAEEAPIDVGVTGKVKIDFIDESNAITVRGAKKDVERVVELVERIEEKARETNRNPSVETPRLFDRTVKEAEAAKDEPASAESLFDSKQKPR